ncbi:MAG: hypothetical protein JRH16_05880 [Deltaproteobacteria bacterium]|nr:hypothetical protein [Deltaproteobacteria bacterium]
MSTADSRNKPAAQAEGAAVPVPAEAPRSSALAENLRRTAVGVVVPEEQQVLLEMTEHLRGVHEGTKELLREVNHRYVGWEQTIEDLHRRAMGDFHYYLNQERTPQAIAVFCGLYEKILDEASPRELRESALRRYLQYLGKVASESGEPPHALDASLARALERLGELCRGDAALAVAASSGLRRLADSLLASERSPQAEATRCCLELLADTLAEVQRYWLAQEDPEQWWRDLTQAPAAAALPDAIALISHARLRSNLAQLDSATLEQRPAPSQLLLALPDAGRMERAYLSAASCVEKEGRETWRNRVSRVRWLIHVLAEEALRAVHEEALAETHRACVHALREADASIATPLVREVFATLRHGGLSASPSAVTLISRLGSEVLAARNPEWTDAFVEQLLDWEFAYPVFAGFTEEWAPRVNPVHVGTIRAFLSLIETDPEATQPLLAALVVHLTLGGVFLADTDIFQRDVSKLLRSPLTPIYHPVKHLLRLLPVYFDEIGAEGELREVSSGVDEITSRRDPLCHFVRKQCHVESNPEVVGLVEATARFWATGQRESLQRYVPPRLYASLDGNDPLYTGVSAVLGELLGGDSLEALFALGEDVIETRLAEIEVGEEADRKKVQLLLRLRQLIGSKYELRHDDVLERLEAFRRVPGERVAALRTALETDDLEGALDAALTILEELKDFVLVGEASEAHEQIYRKRHIAVGIPSLYGSYREEKFEAVGLGFRLESLASVLFDRMFATANLQWITRDVMQRVLAWLHMLRRALKIDGCSARGLSTGISLLEQAIDARPADVEEYANIFQVLSRGIKQLIQIRFLDVYEDVLDRTLPRMLARGVPTPEVGAPQHQTPLEVSERFLRDLIAKSFGLQQVDRLVGRVLRSLVRARDELTPEASSLLMGYDVRRSCVPIGPEPSDHDGAFYQGNKGYMLRRLARYGLPIPDGFILTTEVFRCRAAILACPELLDGLKQILKREVGRIERLSGRGFGDPDNPLLLSVRSGSPMSMPGMLDTFLNVGITAATAEGFGRRTGSPWAAWDTYRRFLQLYGMACGIDRAVFDALMRQAKQSHGAEKKAELDPESMRELAMGYRQLLLDHGVSVADEPFEQLVACVDMVMRSWNSEKARIYREEVQIADAWGTAVTVQSMVYGNLSRRAGTGVVLTHQSRTGSVAVSLRGDFVVQGQGDDVVSGLVETFPISADERPSPVSLERDFPAIHAALTRYADLLINDRGMFHQEIEFTFESEDPKDLYVLQTRDSVMSSVSSVPTFVASQALEAAKVATGIGAGGGALCGRVAHRAEDLETLHRRFPDEPIILLRPDTVPEDVPLVLRTEGMVTALGGATSHAALVAQRLGRTCVVGCRQLEVHEGRGHSHIADHIVRTGDLLSINGIDGSIYLGQHPTKTVRRERLV